MPDQRFTREERLKSRKVIQRLFQGANSFVQYPLRLVWMPMEERRSAYPVQVALSVPKRRFRSAVQRNRIRRLMREAYRLNKHRLYRALEGEARQVAFMVIYVGKEEPTFRELQRVMPVMMQRFLKKYRKTNAGSP